MQQISIVGLDLAKNVFQVHGADVDGTPVMRRKLRRADVLQFFSKLPSCLVAYSVFTRSSNPFSSRKGMFSGLFFQICRQTAGSCNIILTNLRDSPPCKLGGF